MASHSILLVDDDPGIIKALQRLFKEEDYRIYTADSGEKGLEVLKNHSLDLVISDQKMPYMNGSEFLGKVRQQYLDTIRILLTGYSNMEATISAINKGKIYQYISKPWDVEDIKITVKKALDQYDLIQENKRLQEITRLRNEELKKNNELLEERVRQRTEELNLDITKRRQTEEELQLTLAKLRKALGGTINAMALTVETKDPYTAGHQRRVTDLARAIADEMSLSKEKIDGIRMAGVIHDLGKISVPAEILSKPGRITDVEFNLIKITSRNRLQYIKDYRISMAGRPNRISASRKDEWHRISLRFIR